jgi:isopropylmalate/homocitrate/citramalate synthase
MTKKFWKTDKWFTSPWNFENEVRKNFKFVKNIKIHDITLRDGEQQAGIIFTKDEKLRIAEKLIEAGVHRIEAGMPAVSKQDEQAIREIVKMTRKTSTKVFSFARCMKEDVKRSLETGVDGIVVEIPSSEHIIKHAYKWPLQRAIDLSIEATLFAKENGLYTVFFPIDGTRAKIDWFLDIIKKIADEGHMDALAIVDTFGGLAPTTVSYLIRKIKSEIDKPLEAHFHDDFGLAAANTLIALSEGAEVAHTTITGIGERAGNAAYEDVVLSLLTMYGIDIGIKTEMFFEISKLVQEMSGIKVPTNRSIVGDKIFDIESGIITSWLVNSGEEHILELCPFRNDLVGQKKFESVLGKNSGKDNIKIWLDNLGIIFTEDKIIDLVMKVKDKAYQKKGLLNESEFKEIVNSFNQ